jgi:dolichol-phosphate mannosyltransferase
MPVYLWTGFINTMDSQLMFFWILSLLGASIALRRADRKGAWLGWYLAGFGLGGAMLSKYTGVFVGAGIGLALIAHRPWRRHLLSPHVWLGALLGVVMFTPVLLWNHRNQWASFRFQFVDRAEAHPLKSWLTLWSPLNFFLLQLAAVTPLLFAIWLQKIRLRGRLWFTRLSRQPLFVFSTLTALPLLAAMAWKSILFDVHFDWTAPAFLSILPTIGLTASARWRLSRRDRSQSTARQARDRTIWDWSIGTTVGACLAGNIGCLLFLILITPRTGHPDSFGPWRRLGSVVSRYEAALEHQSGQVPLIVGRGKYRLASELAFYASPLAEGNASSPFIPGQFAPSQYTTSQWFFGDVEGLGFAYWLNRVAWLGRDCIYVTDKNDIASVVGSRFRDVVLVDDKELHDMKGGVTYHLAICRGFKG